MIATRALTAAGVLVLAFGLGGLVVNADVTVPSDWGLYLVGGLVLHDAVLAPAAMVGGVLLARVVPPRLRPPVQGGVLVSVSLVLVAIPPWSDRGALPGNDSLLPQDYGTNLLVALAVVWAVVGLLVAARTRRPVPAVPPDPYPVPPARPGW